MRQWSLRVPLYLALKMIRYAQSLDVVVLYAGTYSYQEQLEFDALGITQIHCESTESVQDEVRKYLAGSVQVTWK